jgi:hypothetical protein
MKRIVASIVVALAGLLAPPAKAQSTVLINDNLGDPNADPENFGNR